jgi:hypothetical protein
MRYALQVGPLSDVERAIGIDTLGIPEKVAIALPSLGRRDLSPQFIDGVSAIVLQPRDDCYVPSCQHLPKVLQGAAHDASRRGNRIVDVAFTRAVSGWIDHRMHDIE